MDRTQIEWNPAEFTDVDRRMEQLADIRNRCPVGFTSRRAPHWTISRYKDVVAVARDPATFSNGGDPRFGRALPPLEVDPPVHAVVRRALQQFWLPSRMTELEPSVSASVDKLLEPILKRGESDLVKEFANPLPVLALCALLNITDDRWEELKQLGEQQLGVESPDPEEQKQAIVAHQKLMVFVRDIVRNRRDHPRDPQTDITASFLTLEIDGQPIDDEMVAGMLRLLISAGHNSTTNALGNCFLYLAEHPDTQDWLRGNPEKLPGAIEELLRYDSPVQEMFRWATRPVEIGGQTIAPGDRLGLLWGSGNRDEEAFPQADKCILDRQPNRHLAFGTGIHMCLGAPMARMELRLALTAVLARTRRFELYGDVVRKPYHHMGVHSLPLRFTPR